MPGGDLNDYRIEAKAEYPTRRCIQRWFFDQGRYAWIEFWIPRLTVSDRIIFFRRRAVACGGGGNVTCLGARVPVVKIQGVQGNRRHPRCWHKACCRPCTFAERAAGCGPTFDLRTRNILGYILRRHTIREFPFFDPEKGILIIENLLPSFIPVRIQRLAWAKQDSLIL
jgi:hypothetical protein